MINFIKLSGTDLYLPEGDVANPAQARMGFLFQKPQEHSGSEPYVLSKASWTDPAQQGYFAYFAPQADRNWPQFAANLRTVFTTKKAQFGWFTGDASSSSPIPPSLISASTQQVTQSFQLVFPTGTTGLYVTASGFQAVAIVFDDASNAFVFSDKAKGQIQASLKTNTTTTVKTTGKTLTLPMQGQQQGCMGGQFALTMDNMAGFEAGFMYYAPPATEGGLITALNYPVFLTDSAQQGATFNVAAMLDVLAPLADTRSYLQFTDSGMRSYLTTSLGRPYRLQTVAANAGDISTASRLAFALRPTQPLGSSSQQFRYNLIPAGTFTLAQEASNGAAALDSAEFLCGVTGTEFLKGITSQGGAAAAQVAPDTISFVTGQPAYRLPVTASQKAVDDPVYLSSDVTTSWVRFSTSSGKYVSQPPKSPLYQQQDLLTAKAGDDVPVATLLEFLKLPAWTSDGSATPLVPLVPYAGIPPSSTPDSPYLTPYQTMEAEALNPTRKNAFLFHTENQALAEPKNLAATSDDTPTTLAMTPQGVLAGLQGEPSVWKTMQIAKSESGILQFTDMQPQIRQVMQQNQIFAVISNTLDGQGGDYFEFAGNDQTVEIADWFFGLSPEGTKDSDGVPPILLLKFYPGKSIADLVNDTNFWSQPNVFNTGDFDAESAQTYLQGMIQSACEAVYGENKCTDGCPTSITSQADTTSIYYNFYETVTDPNFSGVLAVNCNLQLNNLPTAIKAVTGGMTNIAAFRAHHVGVSINDTNPEATTPQLVQSSFFALVDYEKPSDPPPAPPVKINLGFEVEYLRALFVNSELRDFSCKLQLTLNNLFNVDVNLDSDASLVTAGGDDGDDDNNVYITGSYQSPNGDSGAGMYSFIAEKTFEFTFSDEENPYLEKITLTKIQFSFLSEADQTSPPPPANTTIASIKSRFAIWGNLEFKELEVLDIFSFEKLTFGDLGIDVGFDLTIPPSPQTPSTANLKLGFNPGDLQLDLGDSPAKEGDTSLLSLLPFKLKSFLYSQSADQTLESLEYIAVSGVPGLSGVKDTFNYALIFDLDLGSLGALVGSLEAFKFSCIIGWKTGDDAGIAFGLQLPSADGKLEINIEGVLKLSIGEFILKFSNDSQPEGPGAPDNLLVVGLMKSYLELLGVRLPPDQGEKKGFFNFALFVPPDNPDKLGWLGSLDYSEQDDKDDDKDNAALTAGDDNDKEEGGAFFLEYLGGGQRVGPTSDVPTNFDDFLEWMQKTFPAALKSGKYGDIYDPEGKWLLVCKFQLLGIIDVGFIFYDTTPFYSLMLNVKDLFNFEITYTKISDSIGLFYANFALPETLRTFQVGAASLTLPSIGVSVYTNGNWKLDVGFPKGDDWSRCFRVEAMAGPVPVTGSGGFYIASLSSATSDVFSKAPFDSTITYASIISFGFALRVGIGKDFTSGPLKAGISVTFFGIIEGSAGYKKSSSTELFQRPDALALKGQVGLIGELYGSIDFAIISASINVTLSASIGMEIMLQFGNAGTNGSILLYVEASVNVSLRVTINLGLFKIHISVSFSASFRFEWQMLSSSSSAKQALAVPVMEMDMVFLATPSNIGLWPGLTAALPIWFAPELAVVFADTTSKGAPWLTMTLTLEYDPNPPASPTVQTLKPFESLAAQMAGWALISVPSMHLSGWDSLVTLDALSDIDTDPDSLVGWIDYDTLLAQLQLFQLTITVPAQSGEAHASVFPMLPFLQVATTGRVVGGVSSEMSYTFSDKNAVSQTYIDALNAYYDQLYVNQNKGASGESLAATAADAATTPLIKGVFLDYFKGLIRATVHQLLQTLQNGGQSQLALSALILQAVGTKNFIPLAGQMANSFRGGSRLPKTDGLTVPGGVVQDTNPLYSLLWQTFPVGGFATDTPQYTVTLTSPAEIKWVASTAAWKVTQTDVTPYSGFTVGNVIQASAPVQLDYTRTGPQAFSFQTSTDWTTPQSTVNSIRPFPANLSSLLSASGVPLNVSVESRPTGSAYTDEQAVPAGDFFWATQIELTVKPAVGAHATFGITGASQQDQALLEEILKVLPATGAASNVTIQLLYQLEADSTGLNSDAIDPQNVFVLRTNTTTVSVPPPSNDLMLAMLKEEAPPEVPVGARIDEQQAFLKIVQQASVTNAPGYYLYYKNGSNTLPVALFSKGAAPITLLITYTNASGTQIQPYFNSIVLAKSDPALLYYAETTDAALEIQYPATAPGSVGVNLTRDETNMPAPGTAAAQLNDLYSLFSYQIQAGTGYVASNLSAPVQPQKEDEQAPDAENPEGYDPDADPIHNYRIFAPLYKVATANQNLPAGQPDNRYASLNNPFQMQFLQTDCFGNQLPNPLTFNSNNLYFDPIIPVDQWQGVISGYDFLVGTAAKANSFTIYLNPSQSSFVNLDNPDVILDHYQTILNQITGLGVSFYRETNLALNMDGTMEKTVLDATQTAAVVKMVSDIVTYLQAYVNATTQGLPPPTFTVSPVMLAFTVSAPGTLPSVFEMAVAFGIQRDEQYISPLLKQNGKVTFLSAQDVLTPIVALVPNNQSGAPGINDFAKNFSAAFPAQSLAVGLNGATSPTQQSANSLARTALQADGVPSDGSGSSQAGPQSLWAVNRVLLDLEIGTATASGPWYASPTPLSNQLQSGTVPLNGLLQPPLPQPAVTQDFTGVDMDLYNRSFFTAVDNILQPASATFAFQQSPDSYRAIAQGRKDLADKYSTNEIDWLFGAGSPFQPAAANAAEYLEEAKVAFGQQMRATLMTAYSVDTIVQFGVTWNAALPAEVNDKFALFGQVQQVGTQGGEEGPGKSGLSTAKLDLTSTGPGLLTFLYGTPNIADEDQTTIDLEYNITHLEYYLAPSDKTPADEARPSMWLQLINGYLDDNTQQATLPHIGPANTPTVIPLIFRQYPTPPTAINQTGVAEYDSDEIQPGDLSKAAQWRYSVIYQAQLTAHDQVASQITYNTSQNKNSAQRLKMMADAGTVGPFTLFEALARFTAAEPVLGPVLANQASPDWKAAIDSLADVVNQVVQNTDWNQSLMFAANVGLANITDHYQITDLPDTDPQRLITLTWPVAQGASSFAEQIAIQALGPDLKPYAGQKAGTVANGITDLYTPVPPQTNDFVTHQVTLDGLNVLAAENATAGFQIQRNVYTLGQSSVSNEFVYTTGLVSFSNAVTPFIVNDGALDVAKLPNQNGNELSARILTMMSDLLNNAVQAPKLMSAMRDSGAGEAAPRRVKVECNYQYPIVAADGSVPDNPLWVTIPVTLARSFDIDPQSQNELQQFSTQFAGALNDWSSARNITYGKGTQTPEGTRFVFDITLYALLSGSNMPLLELSNLQLSLTDIAALTASAVQQP